METDVASIWAGLRDAALAASARAGGDVAQLEAIEPQLAELRPGELRHSRLDVSLAASELGWKPEVGIGEGLRATYEALAEEFQGG
jgi:nucleoside-diphosphate-sugar epimerase